MWYFLLSKHFNYFEFFLSLSDKIWNFFAVLCDSFCPSDSQTPKRSGEKTVMLIGYRLISEFDAPPLT